MTYTCEEYIYNTWDIEQMYFYGEMSSKDWPIDRPQDRHTAEYRLVEEYRIIGDELMVVDKQNFPPMLKKL